MPDNFWKSPENNVVTDRDQDLVVTGLNHPPTEIDTWNNANLEPQLLKNIAAENFTRPRKFQRIMIPIISQGYDVKGHAEAGSGKTASFVIPIIDKILKKKADLSESLKNLKVLEKSQVLEPYCLFIAPTRELADQGYRGFVNLARGTQLQIGLVIGGAPFGKNMKGMAWHKCDIVCATPGKLIKFINEGKINLQKLKFLVFDEIDKLVEKGFGKKECDENEPQCKNAIYECMLHQIMKIVEACPSVEKRQTLVFSATFTEYTQSLISKRLVKKKHAMVTNKKFELPNLRIKHTLVDIPTASKLDYLLELLKNNANPTGPIKRVLIFVNRRDYVYRLSKFLQKEEINADGIEAYNYKRQKTLNKFCANKIQVLVSSDLCGRGIDVKGLETVINYDIPQDKIIYVHRVGRVGRVLEGQAISFFDPAKDGKHASYLAHVLSQVGTDVPEFIVRSVENAKFVV